MAFKTKFYALMFTLLVVAMEQASGCHAGQRSFYPRPTSPLHIQSRKILFVSKGGMHEPNTVSGKKLVIGELRTVPSGPDPLHHNGGTPKKPRTP
ncbi:hypothetical protein P3X46_009810 [Hevea brasiliensis]|uniref:Uncharacterized protein n=1 Tax=Hevea brasiliensis TaxID=3981 RepID=A0ABQ9MG41_HEVBR|nr:hypothetical protein P3X46_009810 [Hevea brasiliensis]